MPATAPRTGPVIGDGWPRPGVKGANHATLPLCVVTFERQLPRHPSDRPPGGNGDGRMSTPRASFTWDSRSSPSNAEAAEPRPFKCPHMSYQFHWPTKTIFGAGTTRQISHYLEPYKDSSTVLLVTHPEAWAQTLGEELKAQLESAGWKEPQVFAQVESNPSWETIASAVEISRSLPAEMILAVGGGSAMDAAKVIAARSNAAHLITVPTTAGTGGEISPWAVISNIASREKESVIAKWPDLALIDPALTLSLPPRLTFFTAIDAFTHGLEAFLSSSAGSITDMFAVSAMRMIAANMRRAVDQGDDLDARGALLEGSLYAGGAMLHAGLGLMHAIANVAGGLYHDLPHGALLLRCLQPVLRFNRGALPAKKFDQIDPLLRRVEHDVEDLHAHLRVREMIMDEADLHLLAARAAENVNASTNPRPASVEQIQGIVEECFQFHPPSEAETAPADSGESDVQ
jgi:alcohol dehydrogenase class IV